MENRKITIGHLLPDLLNLYGDDGNILCLSKRAQWRQIGVEQRDYCLHDPVDFENLDILFIGGGPDREQSIAMDYIHSLRSPISDYIERGGVLLAICGGYQFLGRSYMAADGSKVDGLGLLDLETVNGHGRLIGNLIIKTSLCEMPVVGFENHGGRTSLGPNVNPLGKVLYGKGNNGHDGGEGVLYKNVIGTYLHGPLLSKNSQLCDHLLSAALQNRWGDGTLTALDDTIEKNANAYIQQRFLHALKK